AGTNRIAPQLWSLTIRRDGVVGTGGRSRQQHSEKHKISDSSDGLHAHLQDGFWPSSAANIRLSRHVAQQLFGRSAIDPYWARLTDQTRSHRRALRRLARRTKCIDHRGLIEGRGP